MKLWMAESQDLLFRQLKQFNLTKHWPNGKYLDDKLSRDWYLYLLDQFRLSTSELNHHSEVFYFFIILANFSKGFISFGFFDFIYYHLWESTQFHKFHKILTFFNNGLQNVELFTISISCFWIFTIDNSNELFWSKFCTIL